MNILIYKYISGVDVNYSRDIHQTFPYMITNWNDMTYDLYFSDLTKYWYVHMNAMGQTLLVEGVTFYGAGVLGNNNPYVKFNFIDPIVKELSVGLGDEFDFQLVSKESNMKILLEDWSLAQGLKNV